MTRHSSLEMVVVLDSHPSSRAPLAVAQRYAAGTVLLTSWSADPSGIEGVVQESASADPTISDALQTAAHRGLAWVGIRRDFAPPEQMLRDLLIGTARHADDEVPGFSVFLVDGDPVPFRRILAIVDRSDGPISGLLAYAAVAVADTSGAALDILVIGDAGENPHTEDEYETLAISREQELYDAAVQRARRERLPVRWITAASVGDLWQVVSDQLSQHDYDLVIDDLGDVSLVRVGLRTNVGEALVDGAVGEVPLKLLTQTSLPILLVIDEIRLGLAPPSLLRAGAVAAIALGVFAAPAAASAADPPPPATSTATAAVTGQPDPVDDLITDLEQTLVRAELEALEAPAEASQEVVEAAIEQAEENAASGEAAQEEASEGVAGNEGSDDSTPAEHSATQDATAAAAFVVPAQGPYPAVATDPTPSPPIASPDLAAAEDESETGEADAKAGTATEADPAVYPADAAEPAEPEEPKAPKGGASPADLEKAKDQEAKAKRAYEKDKAQKADSKDAVAEAEKDLADAEQVASAAVADLEVAIASHAEAADLAQSTESAEAGLSGLLPGAPTQDEVSSAALSERAATMNLAEEIAAGEEALSTLEDAEETLVEERAELEERTADAKETKGEYEQAAQKTDVYQESLADTRQSPVAKGDYDLTAGYGDRGGYWSSGTHTGMDFAGSAGTDVMAAASGTVVSTGYEGAYGNQVVIDHGDGCQTTYSHLSSIQVDVGEEVQTGDTIGSMGSTGNTTGTHLHFEVTQDGDFVDPEYWLGW